VLLEAARQVERDDVDIEAVACLLEGALIGWSRGNKVIVLL
jgi:hypothetical protein